MTPPIGNCPRWPGERPPLSTAFQPDGDHRPHNCLPGQTASSRLSRDRVQGMWLDTHTPTTDAAPGRGAIAPSPGDAAARVMLAQEHRLRGEWEQLPTAMVSDPPGPTPKTGLKYNQQPSSRRRPGPTATRNKLSFSGEEWKSPHLSITANTAPAEACRRSRPSSG
jgi:hypothetical protein